MMQNKFWLVLAALVLVSSFAHAQAVAVNNVNIDPNPVAPGSYFTIFASVQNVANADAKDVVATLNLSESAALSSFPFSLGTDSATRELQTIPAFQSAQVQYRVFVDPKATDGTYTMSIAAGERNKASGKLSFQIKVVAQQPLISIISSTPTQVEVGKTTELNLVVKNIGSSSANDITLGILEDRTVTAAGTVVERDLVSLGNAYSYIPQLGVGETATVHIPVVFNPNASSKSYYVPVKMSFYDSAKTQHTSTDYVGLKVVASAQLGLVASGYKPLPVPGQKSQITIDIYNSGLGAAKFLTAKAEAPWMDAVKNEFYIGTIESDDFDSIVLDGKVSPSISAGMQNVKVTLEFQNAFGDKQTIVEDVPVKVFSSSEVADQSNSGFPLPWIIAIIVVIAGVWYFRFRKPANGNGKR